MNVCIINVWGYTEILPEIIMPTYSDLTMKLSFAIESSIYVKFSTGESRLFTIFKCLIITSFNFSLLHDLPRLGPLKPKYHPLDHAYASSG